DSDELHSHILPEILSVLQGLKAENATLKQEIQQISTSIETPRRSVTPVPVPRTKVPQPIRSQEPAAYPGDVFQHRSVQCKQLTRQMRDFTLTPNHRVTPREPSQPAEAVHYYEDNPSFRHGHYPGEGEITYHSNLRLHLELRWYTCKKGFTGDLHLPYP
ncbi:hypothetical protein M9458_026637, partial [Cirrhinus mrigala]